MRLTDAHCHLTDPRLMADLGGVLSRAARAGVECVVSSGCTEDEWRQVLALALAHPQVVPSLALHPLYLANRTAGWLDALRSCLAAPGAVVGEAGLDNMAEPRNAREQEEVFEAQLRLAAEMQKPVVVHCRKAWGRMLEMLKSFGSRLPPTLFHSYSGSAELVPELAALGAHFSFSGSVTWPRNAKGRRAAAAVPANRLLIETDAPDLMPEIRGAAPADGAAAAAGLNEPANLVYTLETVAEIRGLAPAECADLTWRNACRFFGRTYGE